MEYDLALSRCHDTNQVAVNGYERNVLTYFSTSGPPDDASALRVTSTAPYPGQVGGDVLPIRILFDKPIDSGTVDPQSVLLNGSEAPSYRLQPQGFELVIWPQGLQTQAQYQVTLTFALADAQGHGLAAPYSFNFNTGSGDTTAPAVVQTRPADQSLGLRWEPISVYFSENMDPDSIVPATVRIYDETNGDAQVAIHIDKPWVAEDGERAKIEIDRAFEEDGRWQSGHTYRVELDQDITDLAGNGLNSAQVFRFTVVSSYPGSPDAPPSMMGEGDSLAYRQPDGRVTVELAVNASSSAGGALAVSVEDLTQPGKVWTDLQQKGGQYVYTTPEGMDEALTPGPHHLRFSVTDQSNGQSRTLLWTIHVFDAVPLLTGGPADGATDVSLQPSFDFATDGVTGAAAYLLAIVDAASGDTVFTSPIFPNGGMTYSVQVPPSQALQPETEYRWTVTAVDSLGWEVGRALSEPREFATGQGSELSGQITGTLTDPVGNLLSSIQVNVSAWNPDWSYWELIDSTSTDHNGTYQLGGLRTRTYRVCFRDWPSGVYAPERFDDAATVESGTDVAVTAGQTTGGIDAQLALAGHISGMVTDPVGNPLSDINVPSRGLESRSGLLGLDRYRVSWPRRYLPARRARHGNLSGLFPRQGCCLRPGVLRRRGRHGGGDHRPHRCATDARWAHCRHRHRPGRQPVVGYYRRIPGLESRSGLGMEG